MQGTNEPALPSGKYFSMTIDVHPSYGGQTRAMLMRNRILAAHGASPDVLTVGGHNDMDWRRDTLREQGLLTPEIGMLNIYEHYRDTDWPGEEPMEVELEDFSAHVATETGLPDGSPWRRTYKFGGNQTVYDYLRPDGTPFIRIPSFVYKDPATWPTGISKVARDGRVVGTYRSPAGWYRRWLRDLAGAERAFVFLDSRFMVPLVAPIRPRNILLLYVLHNIHLYGERRWDSDMGQAYSRVVGGLGDLDGLVTLTDRQADDIAQRRGRTSNLFTVPNPVDMPAATPDLERDPRLVTVVARIEAQKRLSEAVRVFKKVVAEVPDAQLEIYGRGSRSDAIAKVIDKLDMSGSVTMKGHHPKAREALWRSSAFLMTSEYEGYPLSTLESMSHGCPVVSYDIKYGPREQITDGEDGFLVESGDTETMARRVVQLLQHPELVETMSHAARAKATQHGFDRFLSDWRQVLERVAELEPRRTEIADVRLDVRRLTIGRRSVGPGIFGARRRVHLDATLELAGRGNRDQVVVTLAAVHEGSGVVVELPITVRREKDSFRVSASVPLADLFPAGTLEQDRCRLRMRLTWQNSAWETFVERVGGRRSGLEVGYGQTDEWMLTRR